MRINEIYTAFFLAFPFFICIFVYKTWTHMILSHISIVNYRNIEQAELDFSPKMNCFIGLNGMGKTNLLDAVYYLSFCKSSDNPVDSQNISHDRDFFMIKGDFDFTNGAREQIYCGMKRNVKKKFRRSGKDYERLSDHIGLIPLVLVSPDDQVLILGGSADRRKFVDMVISQYDRTYLSTLIRYNKALQQRNALLKQGREADSELLDVCEDMMGEAGMDVYKARYEFVKAFIPVFREFYKRISQSGEEAELSYKSHASEGGLGSYIRQGRERDLILGYSSRGIHRDDLVMELGGYPVRKEGSQGQSKTYLIALKLAQFVFLKRTSSGTTPLLLLDDVFDKLDSRRVEQIVRIVEGDEFGQIFMTDTNRDHLDRILEGSKGEFKMFEVTDGNIKERKG